LRLTAFGGYKETEATKAGHGFTMVPDTCRKTSAHPIPELNDLISPRLIHGSKLPEVSLRSQRVSPSAVKLGLEKAGDKASRFAINGRRTRFN
jgi:hypothetical protein